MGHHITGLIGQRGALASLLRRLGTPEPTELDFELVLVPLDEKRLDALAMSAEESFEGFTYLNASLAREIGRGLSAGRALYVETDYFGGTGGQAAALFENGALIWKRFSSTEPPDDRPTFFTGILGRKRAEPTKSPISQGLEMLGVAAEPGTDEFDRLGLVRFRALDDLGIGFDDE